MIVIYICIVGIYLFLWISALCSAPERGKHRFFDQIAGFLYHRLHEKNRIGSKEIREGLRAVHPELGMGRRIEDQLFKEYYIKKASTVLLLFFCGTVLSLLLFVSEQMDSRLTEGTSVVSNGISIERNDHEGGSREESLVAEIEVSGENPGEKRKEEFLLLIEEQQYELPLLEQMAEEVSRMLPQIILKGNTSLDQIKGSLDLVKSIEGYPFQIHWESGDFSLIDNDGNVKNENLEKGGKTLEVRAELAYGTYSEEIVIPIHIYPPDYTEEEVLRQRIEEILIAREGEDRTGKEIFLPEEADGKKISWSRKKEDNSSSLFLLAAAAAVLIYLSRDKDLKKEVEKRNRQMMSDYRQLVTKLLLYMGAGITMRNALKKIAGDYKEQKKKGGKVRYVYEELQLTCYELERGVSETEAYENFGKRCRLPQYNKLVNLWNQNLKKGSNRMMDELREAAENAFEERRRLARKLGEEAGTKLLLPMMMMLGIVMVLIMIPAYFSFGL